MSVIHVSARKSVDDHLKQALDILQDTSTEEVHVREVHLVARGKAIPVAVAVVHRLSQNGNIAVANVNTSAIKTEARTSRDELADWSAQLSVKVRRLDASRARETSEPELKNGASLERVIFLDIDGVLHDLESDDMFLPVCMGHLREICGASGASIVLSSSWREKPKTLKMVNDELQKAGLHPAVDVTPVSKLGEVDCFQSRSDEILDWLSRHPSVRYFVALDDADLLDPHGEAFGKHFVLVDATTGLTQADVDRAKEVLQLPINRPDLPAALRIKFDDA